MKILMDCLLILISGFVFGQLVIIHKKGFWSCHLDFIPMVVATAVVVVIAISGILFAFAKNQIPLRNRLVGIFTFAVSLTVLFVEFVPGWFYGGDIYGHEPVMFILVAELALLGIIVVFGLVNLVIDIDVDLVKKLTKNKKSV